MGAQQNNLPEEIKNNLSTFLKTLFAYTQFDIFKNFFNIPKKNDCFYIESSNEAYNIFAIDPETKSFLIGDLFSLSQWFFELDWHFCQKNNCLLLYSKEINLTFSPNNNPIIQQFNQEIKKANFKPIKFLFPVQEKILKWMLTLKQVRMGIFDINQKKHLYNKYITYKEA